MNYILLMNTMRAGDPGLAAWPPQDRDAHVAYWEKLNRELAQSGVESAEPAYAIAADASAAPGPGRAAQHAD